MMARCNGALFCVGFGASPQATSAKAGQAAGTLFDPSRKTLNRVDGPPVLISANGLPLSLFGFQLTMLQ